MKGNEQDLKKKRLATPQQISYFMFNQFFIRIFDQQKLFELQRIQMINKTIELIVYLFLFMCERKSWTKLEDKILKLLHEDRGYKKWSDVAEIMRTQYGIQGRNGKQCRQRYHNHLDQRISKSEWTNQEDGALLKLHNELGNRWALIARQIKGRTDNCVKNRFYSRFRRSIRSINVVIKAHWKKQFKQLKPTFISKVIEITEEYRLNNQAEKKQLFEVCEDLKCRLMRFSDITEKQIKEDGEKQKQLEELIKQINQFNKKNKRKGKKKKQPSEIEDQQDVWSEQRQVQKIRVEDVNKRKRKSKIFEQIGQNNSSVIIKYEFSDQEYEVLQHQLIEVKQKCEEKDVPGEKKDRLRDENRGKKNQKQLEQVVQNYLIGKLQNQTGQQIALIPSNEAPFEQILQNNNDFKDLEYDGLNINQFYALDGDMGIDGPQSDFMYFY